jgi:hypothetical protein
MASSGSAVLAQQDVSLDARQSQEWRELKQERVTLRTGVNLPADGTGDRVSVTVYGGFPPPTEFTSSAYPSTEGTWRTEGAVRERRRPDDAGQLVLSSGGLEGAAASRLSKLRADPQTYRAPIEANGGCTDNPVIFVEIDMRQRHYAAARSGCHRGDPIDEIADLVLSAQRPRSSQK